MSESNKGLLVIYAVLFAGMCLYPPWVFVKELEPVGETVASSYGLLWDPPYRNTRVDLPRLAIQLAVLTVVMLALWPVFGTVPSRSARPSSATEATEPPPATSKPSRERSSSPAIRPGRDAV